MTTSTVLLLHLLSLCVSYKCYVTRLRKKFKRVVSPQKPSSVSIESHNISLQTLRRVTNNFNSDNVLGKGEIGIVYKGESQDCSKISVKRMEYRGAIAIKGIKEFLNSRLLY